MSTDRPTTDLAERPDSFDPDAVLREIVEARSGTLPVAAIRQIQDHRDVMIPRLIQSIEDSTAMIRERGEGPDDNLHFYALFLLAEFRATEAWDAIVESISLPGDLPQNLYGDAITEALGRILAVLVGESYDQLDKMIADESVDPYVREQCVSAYLYLVKEGSLTRDAALERLRPRITEELERPESEFTTYLLSSLIDFAPSEFAEELLQIYDRSEIDAFFVAREEIEEAISADKDEALFQIQSLRPAGILDTIEELAHWGLQDEGDTDEDFDHEVTDEEREWANQYVLEHELDGLLPEEEREARSVNTIRNETPRVGRNEPCPCGSGKKHKKCCWIS